MDDNCCGGDGDNGLTPERCLVHGFAVQYTSLMLIVLAFVVGAFVRPAGESVQQFEVLQPAYPVFPAIIGGREYYDIFVGDGADVDKGQGEALALFLNSHDVDAIIEVFAEDGLQESRFGHGDTGLELAVARSVALGRFLLERGVPITATRVYARGERGSAQAEVTFVQSVREEGV